MMTDTKENLEYVKGMFQKIKESDDAVAVYAMMEEINEKDELGMQTRTNLMAFGRMRIEKITGVLA